MFWTVFWNVYWLCLVIVAMSTVGFTIWRAIEEDDDFMSYLMVAAVGCIPIINLLIVTCGILTGLYYLFTIKSRKLDKINEETKVILDKLSSTYSSPIGKLIDKLNNSKKSQYFKASLISPIETMLMDFIKDSYDIKFRIRKNRDSPDEKLIDSLYKKPHIKDSDINDFVSELTQLLDIQLTWLKEMEDKDNQLDNVAYMERNNKRLEIIKSMSDDMNKLYGKNAKEVVR